MDHEQIILERVEEYYGRSLADQVSDMIDAGLIEEVKLLLKWIGCN